MDYRPSRPAGDVRINLTITEPDGTTTKINTAGASVRDDGLERAHAHAPAPRRRRPHWVALAGSLPPDAPADWYATGSVRPARAGHRFAVDTSEAPLAALLDARPDSAPISSSPTPRSSRRHRRATRGLRGRPGAAATRGDAGRPRRARSWPRWGPPGPSSSTRPARGTRPRRRSRSSAPSAPATRACSATCFADLRGVDRPSGSRSRWRTARRRGSARHHIPEPSGPDPSPSPSRPVDAEER